MLENIFLELERLWLKYILRIDFAEEGRKLRKEQIENEKRTRKINYIRRVK